VFSVVDGSEKDVETAATVRYSSVTTDGDVWRTNGQSSRHGAQTSQQGKPMVVSIECACDVRESLFIK